MLNIIFVKYTRICLSFFIYRLVSSGGKRAIYVLNDEDKSTIIGTYIRQLTDLKVLACNSGVLDGFDKNFESSHVRKDTHACVKRRENYRKYFLIIILFCTYRY